MSRDVRGTMHEGCNFENNLNQTQNCKLQNIFQLWFKLPKHFITINTLVISPVLCP